MNESTFVRRPVNRGVVGGVALLSALIPVYVCAYSALLINREVPVFSRQALNVLLVAAVYTVPFLFTGVFCQFLCTRFSARNVVVFSRAVEVFLIFAGSFFLAPVAKHGPVPLLVFAACLGVVFSFYRPALKIYLADSAERKDLSRTAGVVESMTFLGIIIGTVSAVFCIHFISSTAPVGSATHLVDHLHFGQVQILCAAAQLLQPQGVLQESGAGDVNRWKPDGHLGTVGLVLVAALGVLQALPILQFLVLYLVVVSERAHNGLYEIVQLVLANTRRAYQVPHLATKFVVFVVRIHEFHVGHVGRKCR